MKIGIAGAGLMGRLLAWHLCERNAEIHLFSKESMQGEKASSIVAAGMISPFAELNHLPPIWHRLGLRSLRLWPKIIASLSKPVFYCAKGTVVVTSPRQRELLVHFIKRVQTKSPETSVRALTSQELQILEPEISDLIGCYLPDEAQVDPLQLFPALMDYLVTKGVICHPFHDVNAITKTEIVTDKGYFKVDKAIDCRGLGAKQELKQLRGVRGEIIHCYAPDVSLQRPIRLLHARYPCYVVPRLNRSYVIGATQIESEDSSAITINSAINLLSAAVSVHTGFFEAKIVNMHTGCRPTTLSHTPLIFEKEGVIHINGLFRHGYLLGPAIIEQVMLKFREFKRNDNVKN